MKRKFLIVLIAAALTTTGMGINNSVKASAPANAHIEYQAHVQNIGWQDLKQDGQEAGTDGQGLRVEALKLNLENAPAGAHIKYQAHVQNIGWQEPVEDGAEAGTHGKSYRVEALKIALEGMPGYSVQYRAHVENIGWQPWVSDGQEAGTDGKGLRVEAIEVRIVKTADGSTPTPVDFEPTTPTDNGDHAVLPDGLSELGYRYQGIPINNSGLTDEVNKIIGKTENPDAKFIDNYNETADAFIELDAASESVSTGFITKKDMANSIENLYSKNNGGLYTSRNGKVYKLAGIYTESTKLDSNNVDRLANAAKTLNTQFISNADPEQTFDRVFVNYEGLTNEIFRVVAYFTPAN